MSRTITAWSFAGFQHSAALVIPVFPSLRVQSQWCAFRSSSMAKIYVLCWRAIRGNVVNLVHVGGRGHFQGRSHSSEVTRLSPATWTWQPVTKDTAIVLQLRIYNCPVHKYPPPPLLPSQHAPPGAFHIGASVAKITAVVVKGIAKPMYKSQPLHSAFAVCEACILLSE